MRRLSTGILLLALLFSLVLPAGAASGAQTAYAQQVQITVDGVPVRFHSFVLRDSDGGETSYLQLRDVADTLSGTEAQFNVGWDSRDKVITLTTGAAYTDRTGSEMTAPFSGDQTCRPGTSAVKLDGEPVRLDTITLTDVQGNGYTYFKLRDLGDALGFAVNWSAASGISIDTGSFPDDGGFYVRGGDQGGLGDVMHTYFFDFVVSDAYICSSLGGYTPARGQELLVVRLSLQNTMVAPLTMYDVDFQVRWGEDRDTDSYAWPVTTQADQLWSHQALAEDTLTEDQLPAEYQLDINGVRSGVLVFEVPAGQESFTLVYQEFFAYDSTGDRYTITLPAETR